MASRLARSAALLAVLAALVPAAVHAAAPVFGKWRTHNNTAIVRIYPCGEKLCGVIDRVLDPAAPENDINNPNPGLRGNRLVGTMVLHDYVADGAYWRNGRVYDPRSGSSYRSEIVVLKDGRLKLTGCVLVLCGSKYWTRAD